MEDGKMIIALIVFFSILIISFITGIILTKLEAKNNNNDEDSIVVSEPNLSNSVDGVHEVLYNNVENTVIQDNIVQDSIVQDNIVQDSIIEDNIETNPETGFYDRQSDTNAFVVQEFKKSILDSINNKDVECLTLDSENSNLIDANLESVEEPYIFSNYVEPSKQVFDSSDIEKIVEQANNYSNIVTNENSIDNFQAINNVEENRFADLEGENIQTEAVSSDV